MNKKTPSLPLLSSTYLYKVSICFFLQQAQAASQAQASSQAQSASQAYAESQAQAQSASQAYAGSQAQAQVMHFESHAVLTAVTYIDITVLYIYTTIVGFALSSLFTEGHG